MGGEGGHCRELGEAPIRGLPGFGFQGLWVWGVHMSYTPEVSGLKGFVASIRGRCGILTACGKCRVEALGLSTKESSFQLRGFPVSAGCRFRYVEVLAAVSLENL